MLKTASTQSPGARGLCVIVMLALSAAVAPSARAAEFFVNNASASCSNTGPGTEASPYCTITAALAAHREPGTIITVLPGLYRETATFPASGTSGSPITLRARAGVVVDGTDDFSDPALWAQFSGDVWLAASVTTAPVQVFADDQRLALSTAAPASLPARSFTFVLGQGLYVNAGGGNPGTHGTQVGRRLRGIFASGRSFLVISGFTVTRCDDRNIQLTNSSNIEVSGNTLTFSGAFGFQANGDSADRIVSNRSFNNGGHGFSFVNRTVETLLAGNEAFNNADPDTRVANGVFLSSGSTRNVIRDNRWHDNQDSGEQFSPGAVDNISLSNRSWNNGDHGFDHNGATGTLHLHDVAYHNFKDGFSIEGRSTGTRLFNNIAIENGTTQNEYDLFVDTLSTDGFQSNDNVLWNSGPQPPVRVASSVYGSVSGYASGRAQDTRTVQDDPRFANPAGGDFRLTAGSPAIDNANSGVANWPALDAEGHARADDAGTPDHGIGPVTFADRGALEFQGSSPTTNQPPVARITATPSSGIAPLAVKLDATASSDADGRIVSYSFAFGDGSSAGPQASPVANHTYAAGNFTATVTVTDDQGATASASAAVTVNAPAGNQAPVARITATPSSGTAPLAVKLDATASSDADGRIVSYFFAFGDGNPVVTQPSPVANHTYAAGNFTATVTVTDDQGATASASATVTVNAPAGNQAPVARIIATPASGTARLNVKLDASASSDADGRIASYFFAFGDGNTVGPQPSPIANHVYDAGNFTATVTVTDDKGATSSATASITVTAVQGNQPPVARLVATPASGEAPLRVKLDATKSFDPDSGTVSYTFVFGDGGSVGPQASPVTHHDYAAGTFTATVTVTDDKGAKSSATATITATAAPGNQAPVANLEAQPASGQAPLRVRLDAASSSDEDGRVVSYRFAFGDGTTAGPQTAPSTHHDYDAGTFTATVTVTDDKGATASATATITATAAPVNQGPSARLDVQPRSGQAPLAVRADASASSDKDGRVVSYFFDFGDGTRVGPQSSSAASHTFGAGHWTVKVEVTDDKGAKASSFMSVDVSSPPSNLVANASFEANTSGWGATGGASIRRVSGGHSGSFALLAAAPLLGLSAYGINDQPNWVQHTPGAGTRYHVRAWVRTELGAGFVSLAVKETGSGASFSFKSASILIGTSWTALDVDLTTRISGSTLDVSIVNSPSVLGTAFRVDDVSIVQGGAPATLTAFTEEGAPEPPAADAFLAPGVHPNPVRADGARIVFATSQAGATPVEIFDLAGRRVRQLTGDPAAAPGVQSVTFDARDDDGRRLPGGVYYYQVRAPDAVKRGRLVIVD